MFKKKEILAKLEFLINKVDRLDRIIDSKEKEINNLHKIIKNFEDTNEIQKKSFASLKGKLGAFTKNHNRLEQNLLNSSLALEKANNELKLERKINKEQTALVQIISSENADLKLSIESLKEDNNAQINIIKQLNKENRLLKNRPSKPTIEELERDKIFHGKRNKETYKKCQNE